MSARRERKKSGLWNKSEDDKMFSVAKISLEKRFNRGRNADLSAAFFHCVFELFGAIVNDVSILQVGGTPKGWGEVALLVSRSNVRKRLNCSLLARLGPFLFRKCAQIGMPLLGGCRRVELVCAK